MKNSVKTIDVHFDKETTMIKPKELIEWLGAESLTLGDRRRFNLMLINAWPDIATDVVHEIPKAALRGSNKDNDRIEATVLRMMQLTPKTEIDHKGRKFTQLFHILELTQTEIEEEGECRGLLRYSFSRTFRNIIKNSTQYAQLKKEVIYALPSKYALALYEVVAKRINLEKTSEVVDIKTFRSWLGVEEGKLVRYSNFHNRAIKPSITSINALAEFECAAEPVKRGQKVVGVLLSWKKKNIAAKVATLREVQGSKVGRQARIEGRAESVVEQKALPSPSRGLLTTNELEQLREEFGYLDFEGELRNRFSDFIASTGSSADSVKNYFLRFRGWCRTQKF